MGRAWDENCTGTKEQKRVAEKGGYHLIHMSQAEIERPHVAQGLPDERVAAAQPELPDLDASSLKLHRLLQRASFLTHKSCSE